MDGSSWTHTVNIQTISSSLRVDSFFFSNFSDVVTVSVSSLLDFGDQILAVGNEILPNLI